VSASAQIAPLPKAGEVASELVACGSAPLATARPLNPLFQVLDSQVLAARAREVMELPEARKVLAPARLSGPRCRGAGEAAKAFVRADHRCQGQQPLLSSLQRLNSSPPHHGPLADGMLPSFCPHSACLCGSLDPLLHGLPLRVRR